MQRVIVCAKDAGIERRSENRTHTLVICVEIVSTQQPGFAFNVCFAIEAIDDLFKTEPANLLNLTFLNLQCLRGTIVYRQKITEPKALVILTTRITTLRAASSPVGSPVSASAICKTLL